MATGTKIQWTEATWNVCVGCTKISAGCQNCYALRMAVRLAHNPKIPKKDRERYRSTISETKSGWEWSGKVALFEDRLEQPKSWRKPRMVFLCSMSDICHEDVPAWFIEATFNAMLWNDQNGGDYGQKHIFQVLTKRPERLANLLSGNVWRPCVHGALPVGPAGPIPNGGLPERIWVGITAEDQKALDDRAYHLWRIPAKMTWISHEPALGPLDLSARYGEGQPDDPPAPISEWIKWVVTGGESGPGARPMSPDVARSMRNQCAAAGVPWFFKQWGEWRECDSPADWQGEDPRRYAIRWVHTNGETFGPVEGERFQPCNSARRMVRLGKKSAGNLLDGKAYQAFPSTEKLF
jgi:protein gp37